MIICGLGRKGLTLAREFREAGEKVVVLEQDEHNPFLAESRDLKAVVILGNAANQENLRKARLLKARHLIAVCGDVGANVEIAVQASRMVKGRTKKGFELFGPPGGPRPLPVAPRTGNIHRTAPVLSVGIFQHL